MYDKRDVLSINKDFLVLVPLLGSGLAVIFDVGFFDGLNIHYFTLFSLSEHIVFALEALPAAIVFALFVGALIYFTKPRSSWAGLVGLIGGVILAGAAIYSVHAYFSIPLLTTIFASISVAFLIIVIEATSFLVRIVFGCVFAAFTAYQFGYEFGANYLVDPLTGPLASLRQLVRTPTTTTVNTKSDQQIEGQVVRSGERGILIYQEKARQITFLRWDEIKQISTRPVAPGK
jgi:hypothetical protein